MRVPTGVWLGLAVLACGCSVLQSEAYPVPMGTMSGDRCGSKSGMCCPVCGMEVTRRSVDQISFVNGQTLYTCSPGCMHKLEARPEMYVTDNRTSFSNREMPGDACPVCAMSGVDSKGTVTDFHGGQTVYSCSHEHKTSFDSNSRGFMLGQTKAYCVGASVMGNGLSWQSETCLIYLYQEWVIDSPTKMVVAIVFTAVISFLLDAMTFLRKRLGKVKIKIKPAPRCQGNRHCEDGEDEPLLGPVNDSRPKPSGRGNPLWSRALELVLFSLQVLIGYLIMLVSMTYSMPLILAIVMGYAVGHSVFELRLRNSDFHFPPDANGQGADTPSCH